MMTYYINIKRDVNTASVLTQHVFDAGIGKRNLVYRNVTVDLCAFLSNQRRNNLLRYVYNIAAKFGDLPKRCPFKKVCNRRSVRRGPI